MIQVNGITVTPTLFPDKTSQVWKLSPEIISYIQTAEKVFVKWEFESDSELISVCQLSHLIDSITQVPVVLFVPYLPYGRQDKEISNESTFGQHTFMAIIRPFYDTVMTFDPHTTEILEQYFGEDGYSAMQPTLEVMEAVYHSKANLLCFPDKGASERYSKYFDIPFVTMDKTRDQLTGKIIGMSIDNADIVKDKSILIVDDICDGGRTFREAAIILYKAGAKEVHLFVSHGIFSHEMGVNILHSDGIVNVYTRKGLKSNIRNCNLDEHSLTNVLQIVKQIQGRLFT